MGEPKQELTCLDICNMFGVSRTTVYKWKKKGLRAYKLGGNGKNDPVRFMRNEVLEFAKENFGRDPITDSFTV